jgi:DNA-binding MarR family transcriptional regulator
MAAGSADAALFDHLVRSETRLYNAVGDRLRTEHGLATAQFEYLRHLRDHPEARVAEIAATFAAGVGAISKLTDRLVAKGWVVRRPHPADGRSSLLGLTGAGDELVTAAERTFRQALAELLDGVLDDDQIGTAAATLATLRHALEREGIGTPAG